MALLRRVRDRSRIVRGGTRLRALLAVAPLLATVAVAAGCDSRNPPDQVLRDSLGLEGSEEVHRVSLEVRDGAEVALPASTEIPPGALVEFVSTDRLVRMVAFREEELAEGPAGFLRRTDQLGSAPLLAPDARFVVSFREAPPGRYPFRVEGNYGTTDGVIVVRER